MKRGPGRREEAAKAGTSPQGPKAPQPGPALEPLLIRSSFSCNIFFFQYSDSHTSEPDSKRKEPRAPILVNFLSVS